MHESIFNFNQLYNLINLVLLSTILIYLQQLKSYWTLKTEERESGLDQNKYSQNLVLFMTLGFAWLLICLIIEVLVSLHKEFFPGNFSLLLEVVGLVLITRAYMEYAVFTGRFNQSIIVYKKPLPKRRFYLTSHGVMAVFMIGICLVDISDSSKSELFSMIMLKTWALGTLGYTFLDVYKRNLWIRANIIFIIFFWSMGIVMQPIASYKAFFLMVVIFGNLRFLYIDLLFRLNNLSQKGETIFREKKLMLSFLLKLSAPRIKKNGVNEIDDNSLGVKAPSIETFDPNRVLELTTEFIMEQSGANACGILLLESETQNRKFLDDNNREEKIYLVPKVLRGPFPPLKPLTQKYYAVKQKYLNELIFTQRLIIGEGIIGEVAKTGIPKLISNVEDNPEITQPDIDYMKIETMIVAPMKIASEILGVLILYNKKEDDISKPFLRSDLHLVTAIADQAAISLNHAQMYQELAEKERMEREISMAQEVQRLLLPEKCPILKGYELAAFNRAAWRIGGDYYDFIWKSRHELIIVIADVSGKGVPGALTMAMVRSTIKEQIKVADDLTDLLCKLNTFIYQDTRSDQFVSMSLGLLNLETNTLKHVRAGHEPLILYRQGMPVHDLHAPGGIALGIDSGDLFRSSLEEEEIDLHEGDTLIFYTDGITEAMNENHEEFTLERFTDVIGEVKESPSSEIMEAINQKLSEFTGNIPQHDDLTLVLMQVKNISKPSMAGLTAPVN